jgi:hypothetical protein
MKILYTKTAGELQPGDQILADKTENYCNFNVLQLDRSLAKLSIVLVLSVSRSVEYPHLMELSILWKEQKSTVRLAGGGPVYYYPTRKGEHGI